MKVGILHVTSTFVAGGSESYAWNLARYFTRKNIPCDLWAGEVKSPRIIHPEVNLRTAPFTPRDKILKLGSRFKKLGERVSFARKARHDLVKAGYDILSIHKPYDIPAALWLRSQTGCKIVWRCHGTDFYPGLRFLINKVDAVFCVSDFARQDLLKAYPVHARVIHTGVDTTFFSPDSVPGSNDSEIPVILYFGRLIGWKGVKHLLDSLDLIKDLPWKTRIIGEGPQKDELIAHANALGLADRIEFLPAQKREEIRNSIGSSDICVFPSVGVETFSNALLEAMSSESAVVATNSGGFPEALTDGKDSILAAPGSSEDLASALRTLLQDPALRKTMAKEARITVLERFDAQKSFQTVEELFRSLIES